MSETATAARAPQHVNVGPRVDVRPRPAFGTEVFIDGHEIRGLVDVEWGQKLNEVQEVIIRIRSTRVTVTPWDGDGPAELGETS
jgi:hypothetical protein